MPGHGIGPVSPTGPDPFAPPATQFLYQPQPSTSAFVSPVYTGTAPAGTQLFYSSAQYQSTVAADNGSTLQVYGITGLPQRYPYKLLLEWGTSNQEVVIVTSAPTGNGPYTFTGVLRGQDGGGPQITHSAGAQVNHGVSAADFYGIVPVYNVCDTQFAGGADPTGTLWSDAAFQAAFNACVQAGGGVISGPPGNYKTQSTVGGNVNGTAVYWSFAGAWASTVYYHGSGPAFEMYDSTNYNIGRTVNGGGITGLTVDGTNAAPGAYGAQVGDILQFKIDLAVQNFTGTGSIGVYFLNQFYWTEQISGRVYAQNCTAHVVFDHSANPSSAGSYDRLVLDVFLDAQLGSQDGVVFQNGAYFVDGALGIYGNYVTSATPVTSAVLRVTGDAPAGTVDAGTYSYISNSRLDMCVELDVTTSPADAAYTIYFGSSSNGITDCYGVYDLASGGTFTPSNVTSVADQFVFAGNVVGDSALYGTFSMSVLNSNVAYFGGYGFAPAQSAGSASVYSDASDRGTLKYVAGNDGIAYNTGQYLVQTTSGTTGTTGTGSQSITGLVTPTLGIGNYYLDVMIAWEPTVTAGTTGFGFSAAGGLTLSALSLSYLLTAEGTTAGPGTAGIVTSATLADNMFVSGTRTGSSGYGLCHIWGSITTTASGTLQAVFVNGASADTVTIAAGATMLIRPLN